VANSSQESPSSPNNVGSLVQRFLSAEETTPGMKEACLWRLSDQLTTIAAAERRHTISIGLAMLVFELLNRSLVREASVVGVKISDFGFLQPLLPVAVAFLYLRLMILNRDQEVYTSVYYAVAQQGFPGLYASQIDRLFTSISGYVVSVLPGPFMSRGKRRISFITLMVELLLTITLPLAFCIYAYWQLFTRKAIAGGFVLVTAVPTLVFLTLGVMLIFTSPSNSDPRGDDEW
jgi:hypothetical protein